MKKIKLVYVVQWVWLVFLVICLSFSQKEDLEVPKPTPTPTSVTTNVQNTNEKMQGLWISYISLNKHDNTEQGFKDMFLSYIDTAKNEHTTDLFVHVRAFSDALYKSEFFPYSHLITGQQGKTPDFDPLEFMIETTHQNGMKFHAWINPLRVKSSSIPENLSDDNPYNLYRYEQPYYFLEKDDCVYINPAYRQMRDLIALGVKEIVENYDVDGIHFDDYFYPADMGDLDAQDYELYCQKADSPLSIEKFREANINSLISQVYREIKTVNSDVVFGISPQANFENNKSLSADVYSWCSTKGYVDYICPQIYFSFDNPNLKFNDSLEQWLELEKHENLKMYVGLAQYKQGTDADEGTWLNDNDIIKKQEEISLKSCDGYILYEISSIK